MDFYRITWHYNQQDCTIQEEKLLTQKDSELEAGIIQISSLS
jgi:hypothetical protein